MSIDFKNFSFKGFIDKLLDVKEPAKFVLKVNEIAIEILLTITFLLLVYSFLYSLLFLKLWISLVILLLSPLIFIFVKYSLLLWLVVINWVNSATEYYKSNIKE